MTDKEIDEAYTRLKRCQDIITNDPELLDYVKHIVWDAVQYSCKLEHKKITPGGLVRREYIDELIECELGLREDVTYNPYITK